MSEEMIEMPSEIKPAQPTEQSVPAPQVIETPAEIATSPQVQEAAQAQTAEDANKINPVTPNDVHGKFIPPVEEQTPPAETQQ